jgi:hypothetical protein
MLVFKKFGFKKFGCTGPADEASDFVEITARGYLVESITTTVKGLLPEVRVFEYGSVVACTPPWDVAILCPLCYHFGVL